MGNRSSLPHLILAASGCALSNILISLRGALRGALHAAWRGRRPSDFVLARDGSDWICLMTACQLHPMMALNSCEVARDVSSLMVLMLSVSMRL